MSLIRLVNFEEHGDDRGALTAIEGNKNIGFSIERLYYLHATKVGVSRGYHAHKTLKQIAVCVAGSCRFVLDNGRQKEEFYLGAPSQGLLIEGLVWREMHDFSADCVLLVLASQRYDAADYIRDYATFLRLVGAESQPG